MNPDFVINGNVDNKEVEIEIFGQIIGQEKLRPLLSGLGVIKKIFVNDSTG